MSTDDDNSITIASEFSNSKVRKRFLTQMMPLQNLLIKHGLDAFFHHNHAPTAIFILNKEGQTVIVGIEEGERRYHDIDLIFCIFNPVSQMQYHVKVNQMKGVLRTLVRWGMLGENQIDEDDIDAAVQEGYIHCSGCLSPQTFMATHRFKQCAICHAREKAERLPRFQGFYCSKECQQRHWKEHKMLLHTACSSLTRHAPLLSP